ncbi:putative acetyltransferase EpsM [Variibacter gotjawalensis]|uniref:Putative acetyltransferase EpsM n=1 Tax=Variibacter gotjawalensis TaxID=1333996 RepID=A0A0S3PNR7_9BRAD|nr:NeuD/PglB/VioB family sugar acetyltransferase [Variibacter gotjawalensis]NIK47881.1 UDP-perosamine 4-acetyltransferase [Variibacter gotjawalensis]RZS49760.1 UDP-perosamine 4-acetyltransferase [Variibacter gotjawalensis]BAT57589.1 putative acetyltransferase EpsM [Variibacter gotjawalensis]
MSRARELRRLCIVGAGGHAKVVIDVARKAGWTPVAAFDPGGTRGVGGVPVVGSDEALPDYWARGLADGVMIAIGNNQLRKKLSDRVRSLGMATPSIFHPTSVISQTAKIGQGVVVMANAVVNADAFIGDDCILNTGSIVEHDCAIGHATHIAPRSVLGGNCRVGALTLFGIGSSARPGAEIGCHAVVGAGSVVIGIVPDGAVFAGNPAKNLRPVA